MAGQIFRRGVVSSHRVRRREFSGRGRSFRGGLLFNLFENRLNPQLPDSTSPVWKIPPYVGIIPSFSGIGHVESLLKARWRQKFYRYIGPFNSFRYPFSTQGWNPPSPLWQVKKSLSFLFLFTFNIIRPWCEKLNLHLVHLSKNICWLIKSTVVTLKFDEI